MRVAGRVIEAGHAAGAARVRAVDPEMPFADCVRCGTSLSVRRMGCRGGHCPNCRHPYPHGDCSD